MTASVKLHGSCTREDGLDRTRAYAEQHNIQVMPPQPVFIIVAPAPRRGRPAFTGPGGEVAGRRLAGERELVA